MHPVTWFELNGVGPEGTDFYARAFGWTPAPIPEMNYAVVEIPGGGGIGGGLVGEGDPSTIIYLEVPDLDAAIDRAVAAGATVAVPRTEVPDMVTFAQVVAPDGNVIGLVLAADAAPRTRAVLLYESAEDVMDLVALHFAAHDAHADQYLERGSLLDIGPFGDPQTQGSMAVFTDRASAEAFAASDPFVLNGVVSAWEVRDWIIDM